MLERSKMRGPSTALFLSLALALGCDPAPSTTDAGRDAATSDAATDAPVTGETIADIAAADEDFSILVSAATRAGLVDALDAPGTFTVFAPTNAAFEASGLTQADVDALSVAELTAILSYHALVTEVPSSAIAAGPVTTLANLTLFLGTTGGVTVNGGNAITGGANVVTADVEASNGVIHVVDRVLLPPTIPQLATYGGLTSLVDAVTDAELADELSGAGPFTVFAPTNAAFAALPAVPTGDALVQVLLYHAVSGAVTSSAVPAVFGTLATNDYDDALSVLADSSDDVVLNGTATVVIADLRATNGVVHVIDEVLLPLDVPGAATAAGLTGLLGAIEAAADLPGGTSVAEALSADAPYTVFAPDDDAFTAAAGVIATLTATQVRDVLLYHVLDTDDFPAPVLAADLPAAAAELASLQGEDVSFTPAPPTVEGAAVVTTDIVVTNGVVHVIDAVMVPPSLVP